MEEADPPACVVLVAGSGAWYERIVRAGPQRDIAWRHAATGAEALRLARELAPPLVILDDELALAPGLAERLRQAGAGTLIALAGAAGRASDGADHILPRRFGAHQLRALLAPLIAAARPEPERPPALRTGELLIDPAARRLERAGSELRLTKTEWKLLAALADSAGQVVSHERLLRTVWGAGYEREHEYLHTYARRLRAKLEPAPRRPIYLLSESGLGYRLAVRPAADERATGEPAAGERLHGLPQPATSFVGREQTIAELAALIGAGGARLVTLTGEGGVGKTRVALKVAEAAAGSFADGVWLAQLETLAAADQVPQALAQLLGVAEAPAATLEAALIERLRGRRLLLILDSFEHLLGAAELAARLLRQAPSLAILATSRIALGLSAEHEYRIEPLGLPAAGADPAAVLAAEAVALFVARARQVQQRLPLAGPALEAIAALCRRLDGWPLAIELAAAKSKLLSPQAMLAQLDRGWELLSSAAPDLAPRHRQLLAAIEWSHELLSPAQRRLFRRLGVFHGGAELAAIEALWAGEPGGTLHELLIDLINHSLLSSAIDEEGAMRVGMLAPLRWYARQQLAASGEEDGMRERHAAFFAAMAGAAAAELRGREQRRWIAALQRDYQNLIAALGWLIERGDRPAALRMSGDLARFWYLRGGYVEGRRWLAAALELPGPAPLAAAASAWFGCGMLAYALHDHPRAREAYERSLERWEAAGDAQGRALTLNALGALEKNAGFDERAEQLYQRSLAAWRELGDEWGIANTLTNLGLIRADQGRYDEALECCNQALALRRRLGDQAGLAVALCNLGYLERMRGRHAAARQALADCLRGFAALDHWPGLAQSLEERAQLALAGGDAALAARCVGMMHMCLDQAGIRDAGTSSAEHRELLDRLRAALGDAALERETAAGRAMSLGQALADLGVDPA